jgi:hypothetical protein
LQVTQAKEVSMSEVNTRGRKAVALAIGMIVAMTALLAGCSQASGAATYDSLDSLAAASTAITAGSVTEQHEGKQAGTTVIISSFKVTNAPSNPNLGKNAHGDTAAIAVGDTVQISQPKSDATLLKKGERYLLFLTASTEQGATAKDYSITGAVSGLYHWDGTAYSRIAKAPGDTLPDTISEAR